MFYLTQTSFGYKFKQLRCGLEIERSLYLKKNSFFFSLSHISGVQNNTENTETVFKIYFLCTTEERRPDWFGTTFFWV